MEKKIGYTNVEKHNWLYLLGSLFFLVNVIFCWNIIDLVSTDHLPYMITSCLLTVISFIGFYVTIVSFFADTKYEKKPVYRDQLIKGSKEYD